MTFQNNGVGPLYYSSVKMAGMKLKDLEQIKLNKLLLLNVAIINELGIDPDIVNANGGAIALVIHSDALVLN